VGDVSVARVNNTIMALAGVFRHPALPGRDLDDLLSEGRAGTRSLVWTGVMMSDALTESGVIRILLARFSKGMRGWSWPWRRWRWRWPTCTFITLSPA